MPQGLSPTELFRERILCCFINDRIGVKLLDEFNIDNVCWESRLPALRQLVAGRARARSRSCSPSSTDETVDAHHARATRCATSSSTRSPIRPPERCTAAALRAEAADVDTVTRVGRPADEPTATRGAR